ncbi:MAG: DUF5694 domain-containing protein [Pyrinomonadaceae bacterium]
MVVGSYHFANPGKDVVKSKSIDVSTPERQKEIIDLISRLETFKPTKIVLECDVEDEAKYRDRFAKYLAGAYQLSVNEREQIGFRLAKDLPVKEIYCVDTAAENPGNPSDYNYMEYAAKHPDLERLLKAQIKKLQERGDRQDEQMAKLSVVDQFILLNQPDSIDTWHADYFLLPQIGQGSEYIGANWLSSWYGRNLRILANIIRITDSPDDRILALYGAGHLKLLNQFANESRYYKVQDPMKYLKGK